MRRLLVALFLCLLLAAAVGVLYAQGRAGLAAEASRLRAEELAQRQATLAAIRQELASEVKALVTREAQRPYYEYQQAYVPPDVVSNQMALVPSPLAEHPREEWVALYCQFRGEEFESPSIPTLDAAAYRAVMPDGQKADAADAPYAEEAKAQLGRLEPLRASCVTTLEQGETGQPQEDVFDALITSSNRNLGLVLKQLSEAQQELQKGENGSQSQQAMNSDWQGYQSRGGNKPQTFFSQRKARPTQGVTVRVFPFRPLRVLGPDGWPSPLLMVRRVEESGESWLQGFVVDVNHIRQTVLPAVIERLASPDEATPSSSFELSFKRSGSQPSAVVTVPSGGVTQGSSLPLAPPFDGVTLVFAAPPGSPELTLARSSMLLHGALGLVVLVFISGTLILFSAVRGQRRLARQRADFVAALSHELKAPLTGVRALAELLHDGLVSDPQKQHEYYSSMLTECDRLGRLVQNVLSAARLERGALPVLLEVMDPLPVLVGLADRFTARLDTAGFVFKVELPERLPPVRADREGLDQIVANLLDNAAKYGAGERKLVTLGAAVDDGMLVVSVSDRGPGVPVGLREEIFGRFYRSPDVPREIGGAGLGLAIARAHARGQGGDLVALAQEGGGARFELRLPLAGEST